MTLNALQIASTWEGIRACEALQKQGIDTNMTLLFSFGQVSLSNYIRQPAVGQHPRRHGVAACAGCSQNMYIMGSASAGYPVGCPVKNPSFASGAGGAPGPPSPTLLAWSSARLMEGQGCTDV